MREVNIMEQVWFVAALWLGLALLATLLSIWFRISTALSEILVGTVAQLIIGALIGQDAIGAKTSWVGFLAGTGAIVLTFLAGAELDDCLTKSIWRTFNLGELMEKQQSFHSMSALRIYLKRGNNRPARSWWGRVFEKPLSTHLIQAALKAGIIHAAVNLGHMGFSKGAKTMAHEVSELPMHTLPVCVELLAPKRQLEQFIRQEVHHLKETTMVMVDGVHISSLYIAELEHGVKEKEHTVEYITGGSESIRVNHVQLANADEEAVS